jgi:hypothetical protein
MGGLWSRARCCPFIISIKTHQYSTLRPAQITMPRRNSLRILFHGKYCQLLFCIYIHARIRLYKYIPLCCLSLSTLRVLTLTRHKHIVHVRRSLAQFLSHSKLPTHVAVIFGVISWLIFTALMYSWRDKVIPCLMDKSAYKIQYKLYF